MRGYKKLRVWQDAKALFVLTWKAFKKLPYEAARLKSQQFASIDSVHRNIALGSLGESASALDVYGEADVLSEEEIDEMDALAWKLENGLKKLVESLQEKQNTKEWSDTFLVKESNEAYTTDADKDYSR